MLVLHLRIVGGTIGIQGNWEGHVPNIERQIMSNYICNNLALARRSGVSHVTRLWSRETRGQFKRVWWRCKEDKDDGAHIGINDRSCRLPLAVARGRFRYQIYYPSEFGELNRVWQRPWWWWNNNLWKPLNQLESSWCAVVHGSMHYIEALILDEWISLKNTQSQKLCWNQRVKSQVEWHNVTPFMISNLVAAGTLP